MAAVPDVELLGRPGTGTRNEFAPPPTWCPTDPAAEPGVTPEPRAPQPAPGRGQRLLPGRSNCARVRGGKLSARGERMGGPRAGSAAHPDARGLGGGG